LAKLVHHNWYVGGYNKNKIAAKLYPPSMRPEISVGTYPGSF